MKKIAIVLILIGILLTGYGSYALFTTPKKDDPIIDDNDTQNEIDNLLNYLSSKYKKKFDFMSRYNKFCLIQVTDSTEGLNSKIDDDCSQHQITDYIYKVKDENGLEFYVKDVTLEDNVTLLDSLKNTQSAGYYDNYVIVFLLNKYKSKLLDKFSFLENISNSYVFFGLGIEDEHSGDKYMYQNMGVDAQNSLNLNMSFEELLESFNKLDYSFDIGLYVKTNTAVSPSNYKEIVNSIYSNDLFSLGYNLRGKRILIEFNDNIFIEFKDGYLVSIYKYNENIFEENPKKIYDSVLINNDAFSEEGITLNSFNKIETIEFDL